MSVSTQYLVINKRDLTILFRIGCPDSVIIDLLKTGKITKTGDELIDSLLEDLVEIKKCDNRGGNNNPTGQNQYSPQSPDVEKINNIINKIGKDKANTVLIDEKFSCSNFEIFKPYLQEIPKSVIQSVEDWLRRTKHGETVTIEFITKQFFNFAKRQNKSIFKENTNG